MWSSKCLANVYEGANLPISTFKNLKISSGAGKFLQNYELWMIMNYDNKNPNDVGDSHLLLSTRGPGIFVQRDKPAERNEPVTVTLKKK